MVRNLTNNRSLAIFHDLAMIPVAWLGAYWLRFNLDVIPLEHLYAAVETLAIVVVIQTIAFRHYGLYRGVWRFASVPDLVRIRKAVLVGMAFSAVMMLNVCCIPCLKTIRLIFSSSTYKTSIMNFD